MTFPTIPPAAGNTLPREVGSILLLQDLDVLIPVPQSVKSGSKVFSVLVDAQPRQDITNPASAVYTASLGGVNFTLPMAGGTVSVTVPVTAGVPLNLVHRVNYENTDMNGIFTLLFGADITIEKPMLGNNSALDLLLPKILSVTPNGGWTPSTASNVASNPVNAIRAITATVSQSAVSVDTAIATTGVGNINFARPNADRIVFGAYSVTFSVNLNGFGGATSLKIGETLVFAADAGQVIYLNSPAAVLLDDDVDVLPVTLTGGEGTVIVTISGASRVVGTGNLDNSGYATLAFPASRYFRALQVDENPNLGVIKKAKLAIEWFGNGVIPPSTVQVKWAGRVLGFLAAQSVGGGSINQTITANVVSQGNAALPTQPVNTTVAGGLASLSHVTVPRKETIAASLGYPVVVGGLTIQRGFSLVPNLTGWAIGLGVIVCKLTVTNESGTPADPLKFANIQRADGSKITSISADGSGWTLVATSTYQKSVNISEAPARVFWNDSTSGTNGSLLSLTFEYNAALTNGVVNINNTPASGSSAALPARSLGNSGISVSNTNGTVQLTIPEAPRTTVTTFDLPDVTQWQHMTGKTVEIEILGDCPSIQLVQVQLAVDYDSITQVIADPVTATVTGLSGNPADVIAFLSTKLGEKIDPSSLSDFRDWCSNNNFEFARRINEPTDVLQLRQFALEQCHAILANAQNGWRIVRLLDLSTPVREIDPLDLFQPEVISWSDRVETQITLRYAEDYISDRGFLKTLEADSIGNVYCKRGLRAIKVNNAVTIEAGFIRDDAVAALYFKDYCRLYGQPSRMISLELPFNYADVEEGDLIQYLETTWRVMGLGRPDGYVSITAKEIPAY